MSKDDVYSVRRCPALPFEFNSEVAGVFDDMINRSVPFYGETIRQQSRLIQYYYRPQTRVYDLGCSTGNLEMMILERADCDPLRIVAVDNSHPMLEVLHNRLRNHPRKGWVETQHKDILALDFEPASVVVINFTLQFLPLPSRDKLIQIIHDILVPGGILLFSEKIVHPNLGLSDLQQQFHYRFKRENGYSDLEISQKREALENVLIPETAEAHLQRLTRSGFGPIDIWQKWFNFSSWICLKSGD